MARASRNVRKLRRVRRERTLAYRMADKAILQRDQARLVAMGLEEELKKREASVTITKLPDDVDDGSVENQEITEG